LASGDYTITAKDNNGCVTNLGVVIGTTKTEAPTDKVFNLKVYPNPTSSLVWMEVADASVAGNILICDIFNAEGRFLRSERLIRWNDTLRGAASLEDFPKGIYTFQVRGSVGAGVRVVKE
jgi:hypothetical protein